jgi:hypothetical protein
VAMGRCGDGAKLTRSGMGAGWGRDDGPFFCPDAALHECCEPSVLLCMGLFSCFFVKTLR